MGMRDQQSEEIIGLVISDACDRPCEFLVGCRTSEARGNADLTRHAIRATNPCFVQRKGMVGLTVLMSNVCAQCFSTSSGIKIKSPVAGSMFVLPTQPADCTRAGGPKFWLG